MREPKFDASGLLSQGTPSADHYDPLDEGDVSEDNVYHGRKVRWLGHEGVMMKLPAYMIVPMPNNPWYPDMIATYVEAIEDGDLLEAPAARIHIVNQDTIDYSVEAYESGEEELLPFEQSDLGKPYAVLLDGNHRAFAAILAGESYIWVYVGENYRDTARPWLE